MKIYCILLVLRLVYFILILLMFNPIWCVEIMCEYDNVDWGYGAKGIRCEASCEAITSPNETVTLKNVEYDNNEVKLLRFYGKTNHYMPNGFEKIFPRLLGLYIYDSGLKEITQDDLKPFPELRFLGLWTNNLEYLESDLFKFNPDLRFIYFNGNKLKMIGENLFVPLINLEHIWSNSAGCLNVSGKYSEIKDQLIQAIKKNCRIPEALEKLKKESDKTKIGIQKLESEIEGLKQSFKSCDGNLATASKFLYSAWSKKQVCGDQNFCNFGDQNEATQQNVTLTCNVDPLERTTCTAENFKVDNCCEGDNTYDCPQSNRNHVT